jgi:predicted permease
MNLRDWQLRARASLARRRVERELADELCFHIERETQKYVAEGMTEAEARRRALARFGSLPLAADECRDARGTAFVDDTIRDVLYALRGFKRTPLVAFTIVSTVALGLGLVAVAFSLLNMFLFGVDQVPDVREMSAVERPRSSDGERPRFTRAQFEALRRETDVFTDAYAARPDIDSRVDGRMVWGTFVTGNFFQVLRVNAAMGRTLTAADDEPFPGRTVMVLSHRGWDRLFARDLAVLGRTLFVNGVTFEIVGVMPDRFRGLSAGPPDDYWAPLSTLGQVRPIHKERDATGVDIIGRLKPGMSRQAALAQLAVWNGRRSGSGPIERSVSRITLVPKRGTVDQPLEAMLVTAPLFFAFGLILLIGCANVINLLLARGVARQREIGVRLSLGATRGRIVRQLLTESLLLALAAAAAGFAISRVVLAAIVDAVMTSMPPDIGDIRLLVPDADWRVVLFLILAAGVSTMFFGLAPALHATRIEPLRTIRGEVVRDARPGRARNFLVGLQVSASALLLIAAAVFLRSTFAAATADPGMRTSDTVTIQIANEASRTGVVQAVTAEPSVASVAASWPDLAAAPKSGLAEAGGAKTTVTCRFVSPEYFSVLDIAVVRGRAFTPAERVPNLSVAILSETTARALWPDADAVGQVIHFDPDPKPETRPADEPSLESRTFTVVGVVRDVAGFRIAPFTKAVVYLPANAAMPNTSLIARVYGDPELARQTLVNRLTTIDLNMANRGQVGTMLWVTRMETYFLQLAFWFTVVLGGLALALTVSGLFGVLSYLVEQRSTEIGVRMALGATPRDITRMVLSQSIRPVGFGLVVGGGSAAGLAALLLTSPAAPIGEIVHILDPAAYSVSMCVIVAACVAAASIPAARAARLDPTRTLRQD